MYGGHRFYLNKPHAPVMLVLGIIGVATMGIGVGIAVMIGLWLWVFVDLFSIQAWVAEHNQQLEAQATAAVAAAAPAPAVPKESLESRLIKAAQDWDGELTSNRAAALTFESFEDVEACLKRLVEAGHVDVDNRPGSGVIVYKFGEL